jgi:hypothetical protein
VPGKAARFHWCVAPMGLQGLPVSFARLMDYVMRGILGVLTYIDDVLVHNKGHEDHLRTVEEVLLRLRKYGLKLNADKSIFGATTLASSSRWSRITGHWSIWDWYTQKR